MSIFYHTAYIVYFNGYKFYLPIVYPIRKTSYLISNQYIMYLYLRVSPYCSGDLFQQHISLHCVKILLVNSQVDFLLLQHILLYKNAILRNHQMMVHLRNYTQIYSRLRRYLVNNYRWTLQNLV